MPEAAVRFEQLPAIAEVDRDRLCTGCGQNLRSEPIRQDPQTQALVCRCRHCERIEPMVHISTNAQLWLYRYGGAVLAIWIAAMLGGLIGVAFVEAAIPAYALEKLTTHSGRGGSLVIHQRYYTYRDEYALLNAYLISASFGLGLMSSVMAVLLFPHWRRWGYILLAVGLPVAAAGPLALFWHNEARHLFWWGMRFVAGHAYVQVLGGLIGVFGGRPLVRLLARLALPPRWLLPLAFLWTVDGKPLPGRRIS